MVTGNTSSEPQAGIESVVLQLRSTLEFLPVEPRRQADFTVVDADNDRYYRIGWREYLLLSACNGQCSIGQIRSRLQRDFDCSFDDAEVHSICQWAIKSGLASRASSHAQSTEPDPPAANLRRRWMFGPLMIRAPLCDPDRWLDRVVPWVGWVFAPRLLIGWISLIVAATVLVVTHWRAFCQASRGILSESNWLILAAIWFLLKVAHECGHAIVCKQYGGRVRQAGVVMILFAPLAYVDVSSAWRFRTRWYRVHVALAGILVDLTVAAVAVLIWNRTSSDHVAHICYLVAWTAGLGTLLFNANPLMRFDGYYALAHGLDIPNLASDGQQYTRWLGARWLLGLDLSDPLRGHPSRRLIRVHAIGSLLWRVFVMVSLITVASMLFYGAGIALALAAVVSIVYRMTKSVLATLRSDQGARRVRPERLLVTATALLLIAIAVFAVQSPRIVSSPGVVEHSEMSVVRAPGAGFVRSLNVQNGQAVQAGDVLLELENEELRLQVQDLQAQLESSRIASRVFASRHEISDAQAERLRGEGLRQRLEEKRRELNRLTIVADRNGRVVARRLPDLLGQFVKPGTDLMVIASGEAKEFRLAIDQSDVEVLADHIGGPVDGRVRGVGAVRGTLERIEPRATTVPHHPALSARNGGPLAVRAAEDADQAEDKLLQPRFVGVVRLSDDHSQLASAGQLGGIHVTDSSLTLAQVSYRLLRHWYRDKLDSLTTGD